MTELEPMKDRDQPPLGVGALVALSIVCFAAGIGAIIAGTSIGYALVGVAVLMAVWARIAQAGFHHEQTMIELRKLNSLKEPPRLT
jgi:hypothetical protein